ncbi:MAG: hypothetical protein GWN79_20710, partial [Actinobacteria bacterium]|nr:hypothetical protein [Actinomycetota bacterium]NIS34698.1 hypothetical protein [Actinomycetota bacterium]NIT97686.1 hypothetical protein [Actinomycetota bacterium]NIU21338.1 hypothetical protein [Actinomycetota bacterium]NIU69459.1 hypothetical protein [Actinomycetota bacterium]
MPETLHRNARPPMSMDAAPASGTASATPRPTARPRTWVTPLLVEREAAGHDPDDPAVRRFWSAIVGPSAVADLLRLTAAARQQRRIREPVRLAQLAAEGLVDRSRDLVLVRPRIPFLG